MNITISSRTAAAAVLVVACSAASFAAGRITASPAQQTAPVPSSAVWLPAPDGYVQSEGQAAAWRWGALTPCGAAAGCWAVEVYAEASCRSGIAVRLNVSDQSGTVVESPSDATGPLSAGQKGRLVLLSMVKVPGGGKPSVASVECL